MRKLIHIPLAHTYEELCAFEKMIGKKPIRYPEREDEIERYLKNVEIELNKTKIHRIYVDTLFQDTEEERRNHINYYLKKGSKTHQLINNFMQKGGILEKTEDKILVFEGLSWANEYIKGNLSFGLVTDLRKDNLKDRDGFIGKRIDETLKDGECGALFIGGEHKPSFSKDIIVEKMILPDILLKNPYQRNS
ncbi:hypothetical protein D4Q76_00560 [archaeon]|nr:MAG: hypothetical protein D4Q76_00560 [archaeon]